MFLIEIVFRAEGITMTALTNSRRNSTEFRLCPIYDELNDEVDKVTVPWFLLLCRSLFQVCDIYIYIYIELGRYICHFGCKDICI